PGMVYSAQTFRDTVDAHGVPYTIRDDERAALRYLAHRPPRGPVLSPAYIGTTVPALAGRRTLAGYPALDLGKKGPGAVTAVFDASLQGPLPILLGRGEKPAVIADQRSADPDVTGDGRDAGREVLEHLVAAFSPGPVGVGQRHDPDVELSEQLGLGLQRPGAL